MSEEIEIFEGRFKASVEDITRVFDNFITKRHYNGIKFVNFQIGEVQGKRMYYGTRLDDTTGAPTTILLGYLDVTPLTRLSDGGVRVRLVCAWPPLVIYWEEVPTILASLFSPIESQARIKGEHGDEAIDLTLGKSGRQPDESYDQAFSRLQDGESYESVFEWYCQGSQIIPNKYDRNRFKAAMKRRQNKS